MGRCCLSMPQPRMNSRLVPGSNPLMRVQQATRFSGFTCLSREFIRGVLRGGSVADGRADGRVLEEIRRAFASGKSADGEALLAQALEAGLPWDAVTRAVAEGVAVRFSPPARAGPSKTGTFVLA